MKIRGFVEAHKTIFLVLIIAFLFRLILTPFGTLETPDMNDFRAWSSHVVAKGPREFYGTIWADYTPGYLYVLWLLGIIKADFPVFEKNPLLFALFKLPAILADVASGLLIYLAVSRFNKKFALFSASLYLFNPAVFVNSAMWGQTDGIIGFFALAAVFFAADHPFIGAFFLGFGALIKPPAGLVAPLIGLLWVRIFGFWRALLYTIITVVVFVGGFLPFTPVKSLFPFILERLSSAANQYPYTSENAFNFWALVLGLWKPDAGWPKIIGIVITIAFGAMALWFWWRAEKSNSHVLPMRYLAASIILMASFFFLTRMHERYLLPAFALFVVSAAEFPLLWVPYTLLSGVYLASLRFSYVWVTQEFKWIFSEWVMRLLSFVNLVAFGIVVWVLTQKTRFSNSAKNVFAGIKERLNKLRLVESPSGSKYWYIFLGIIIFFSLLTRLYGLGAPSDYYFDEIYHSFTAKEYLHKNPDAWMWNSTPPKDRAYDWVQPPTAKLLMAGSMWVIGETPAGWRMPGVLLGVGAVLFVYLIGVELFKNKTMSLLAAALFALDGLPLVLSRIGTNDSTFLFFTLGTIYFFIRSSYFFSSSFFGLAASTKLSFIWIPPICVLLFFVLKKKWGKQLLWFVVIPPAIYFLSFAPFFALGHTWSELVELHNQMFWYHSHLVATHPFSSPWWSWPLMLKPIWFFTQSQNGVISNIYAQGNPALFWLGFLAVIFILCVAIITRRRELWIVLIAYGGLFIPWSFSPRIMFLYHYLPSVPFLCLSLSWAVMSNKHWKKTAIFLLILAFLVFIWIYPRLIGIPVTESFNALYYKWLPS